jgi:uncharacterized protein YraI
VRTGVILLIWLLALLPGSPLNADEDADAPPPTGVYVTTQDFISLREGPGTGFNRLAVIDPAVTLPAYGRTSDVAWVQVLYRGEMGWLSALHLVWSGDVIDLPVDGINPYPFVRRAAALGVTTRETPIYPDWIVPGTAVGAIPAGEEVELTGRLGDSGFFAFQVRWGGQLYWVSNYNIRITDGDFRRLLDLAYLYPYGRLVRRLEADLARSIGSFRQIDRVWASIARGRSVACAPIPPRVARTLTNEDVGREQLFVPAVTALDRGIAAINGAISAFEDACNNPDFILTADYVNAQQTALTEAERNLIVVGSLLEPLRVRNPQLQTTDSPWTGGY